MEKRNAGGARRVLLIALAALAAIALIGWLLINGGMTRMQAGAASVTDRPLPTPAQTDPAGAAASAGAEAPSPSPLPAQTADTGTPIFRTERIDPDVTNILLIGTDSRKTRGNLVSGNADTIMLASYHKRTQRVTLVSFMRDCAVTIGGLDGPYGKLRTAYTKGGAGMLINTLNEFFALDIQQYCAIGLNGFVAFTDETLGGLDMTLTADDIRYINDRIAGYENEIDAIRNCPPVTDPPGTVHLTGAQLLIFIRNRTTAVGGGDGTDYDRAARQQAALTAIYRKILAEKPLDAAPGIIAFALKHVETNMTAGEIYDIAVPLMTDAPEIVTVSVPFSGTWEYGGDGAGILFYRETAVERLHEMLYGTENGETK